MSRNFKDRDIEAILAAKPVLLARFQNIVRESAINFQSASRWRREFKKTQNTARKCAERCEQLRLLNIDLEQQLAAK